MKVPGRKTIVSTEMVFIAVLSRFIAAPICAWLSAIFFESSASPIFILLSLWRLQLYS